MNKQNKTLILILAAILIIGFISKSEMQNEIEAEHFTQQQIDAGYWPCELNASCRES